MIAIDDDTTIGDAFARAVAAFPDRPFLACPVGAHKPWHHQGFEITFAEAARAIATLSATYQSKDFGRGHRVAMLLDNRPEHFLHKLALNAIGACVVPINPDYRATEIAYLLEHSEADLALVAPERRAQVAAGLAASSHCVSVVDFDALADLPQALRPADPRPVSGASEASILYTSGTTGRPKGCVLSHTYELASGDWYARLGKAAAFRSEGERIYNPLPVYHVNSSIVSFYAALLSGSCQIQADRFSPTRWWSEVRQTRASVVHYLGIIVPLLLNQPPSDGDTTHGARIAIGAGVEPTLHAAFEERFGLPLIEIWGMTEMVRLLMDNEEPRRVGTRAFGKPADGIDVRVVDDADQDVAPGTPGEMVLRHSAATPRRHFFSGYLKDDAATEQAWRSGWFHTGDTVRQSDDGMLHFVDRKKNIIRRSGENIAAAEIEAALQAHPLVAQVAVLAVPDDIREEEVFACVVLARATPQTEASDVLFAHCLAQLAYYKAPGYLLFVDDLPTTGTQKIQKHQIFADGRDPRTASGVIDLRHRKLRGSHPIRTP